MIPWHVVRDIARAEVERAFLRIRNTFRLGQTTLAPKEDGVVQIVQVTLSDNETLDVTSLQHYGFATSMPIGTDILVANVEGHSSKGIVVATNNRNARPQNMAVGEVMVYDNKGNSVHLKGGVSIIITSKETVHITAPKGLSITTGTGAEGMTITGDITQTGGSFKTDGDVTGGKVSLRNHTHGGVRAGGDSSGPPNT